LGSSTKSKERTKKEWCQDINKCTKLNVYVGDFFSGVLMKDPGKLA
jgi:hypothetical protein